MDTPVIRLKDLSKHYRIRDTAEVIKAIDNVTFEIQKGSLVGLVGKNGCGKSTLLKMIAGITKPTLGNIEIRGALLAFTDFGVGFHPDLSGRENIYLACGLYGLEKAEITSLLPEIIAFSELEKFFDMPVKNYSQGMFLRLAFSMMMHLPVQIVLIDEALAVGDEAFRQKCYEKIRMQVESGLTMLFVSHNYEEIAGLCDRCIVLDQGKVIADGKPDLVYNAYIRSLSMETHPGMANYDYAGTVLEVYKPGYIKILSIDVKNADNPKKDIDFTSPIAITVFWEKLVEEGSVLFDIILSDKMNMPFLATSNYYSKPIDQVHQCNGNIRGKFVSKCLIPPFFINHGLVKVSVLGTMFYNGDNNFSLFKTKRPLSILVKNSENHIRNFLWADSNAPIRTSMNWEEIKFSN